MPLCRRRRRRDTEERAAMTTIRRRGAALAVMTALVAGPAMADGGPKAPPATGNGAIQAVAPGACTPEQRAVIDEAFAAARERVRAAISLIDQRPDDPHIRRWFGATPRKVVRHHFALIEAGLQDSGRFRLRCNDPDRQACPADAGSRFAYARGHDRLLGFCPAFFRTGTEGQDARFGVVVHERSATSSSAPATPPTSPAAPRPWRSRSRWWRR
jgi:hypothetical protein